MVMEMGVHLFSAAPPSTVSAASNRPFVSLLLLLLVMVLLLVLLLLLFLLLFL